MLYAGMWKPVDYAFLHHQRARERALRRGVRVDYPDSDPGADNLPALVDRILDVPRFERAPGATGTATCGEVAARLHSIFGGDARRAPPRSR